MIYVCLLAGIVCEVIATTALKSSDGFTRPGATFVTLVGYSVALYLISLTTRALPLAVVYAVWAGLGIFLVTLIAWQYHREPLDFRSCLGLILIFGGIVTLHSAHRVSPDAPALARPDSADVAQLASRD